MLLFCCWSFKYAFLNFTSDFEILRWSLCSEIEKVLGSATLIVKWAGSDVESAARRWGLWHFCTQYFRLMSLNHQNTLTIRINLTWWRKLNQRTLRNCIDCKIFLIKFRTFFRGCVIVRWGSLVDAIKITWSLNFWNRG